VMFNSSSSTMPLKKRDLSFFLFLALVHTRTRTCFPYKLFCGLAFKSHRPPRCIARWNVRRNKPAKKNLRVSYTMSTASWKESRVLPASLYAMKNWESSLSAFRTHVKIRIVILQTKLLLGRLFSFSVNCLNESYYEDK